MATTGDFDLYYSDEPFSIMDQNQREWYDPDLISMWRQNSIFRPIMAFTKNLMGVRATKMHINQLIDPHPDTTPLASRQIWAESIHIDSRQIEVEFQHNGSKIALHKYDDMVTYWKQNGAVGLRPLLRGTLGLNEVEINDMLARNALIDGALTSGYTLYMNDAEDFGDVGITSADLFDVDTCREIWLGMSIRGVPAALGPDGNQSSIVAFTSPGVIYDIQGDDDWVSVLNYHDPGRALRYEVGMYKGVRFVQSPKLILWNCGTITARAPINSSRSAGDGAPASTTKVDGAYKTGQQSSSITHNIQVGAFTTGSAASLAVGDIITLHKTTTDAQGVTSGVDYSEGTLLNRRIMSITASGNNTLLGLDLPILIDYDTDLGGGTYGYITKGRNIHATIFIGGPQAIVAGVAQPPRFYTNDPIDDFKAIYRFSWDQYMGYQLFRPEVLEVVFSAGSTRYKGAKVIQ